MRELEADPVDLGHQDEGLGQAPYHSESARICCLSGASGWDNPEMTFLSDFERTSGNFCTFIDDGNGVWPLRTVTSVVPGGLCRLLAGRGCLKEREVDFLEAAEPG